MLLNCTPHALTIGSTVLPPSGMIARVAVQSSPYTGEEFFGCKVCIQIMGPVTGLPRDAQGNIAPCVVSGMVLAALPAGTMNVYAPRTDHTAIRKAEGQIIAVTELVTKE